MNERISELAETCYSFDHLSFDHKKFAELVVKECIDTLDFHGFDDAIPYIKWMATNRFGVKW